MWKAGKPIAGGLGKSRRLLRIPAVVQALGGGGAVRQNAGGPVGKTVGEAAAIQAGGSIQNSSIPQGAGGVKLGRKRAPFASVRRSRYNRRMPFVVKAMGRTGTVWLSEANELGFRTLAPGEMAGIFETVTDARTAIAVLPRAFEDVGLIFYVERVD
jgi:hypothetical protein